MKDSLQSTPAVIVNVDDHEPARYARTRVLLQAGFEVHDAATGSDALRLMSEVQPDIFLLDVHLPDISGIEVCRRIKTQQRADGTIVLQISASAVSAPQATIALNTGADAYLVEPVDPDVLVATVRAFLRLRATERALAKVNQELSEKNAALNNLNEALRRSNEDLEHFAYVASHDLQEPLRTITTHIQLLERLAGPRFNAEERQLFGFVVDGGVRMSRLIQDVLAYSGIGKEAAVFKPINLEVCLSAALKNLSEMISKSEASVVAGPLPVVLGDLSQLSRMFQNLIGNSIKYTAPGKSPRVEITGSMESSGDWLIRIRDNGIGIDAKHLDVIFEPFRRLHGHEIPGTGIGLALCRRIVENHGGKIWVESRRDEGSIFCFTLKAAAV